MSAGLGSRPSATTVGGAVHVSGATSTACSLPTEKCAGFCPVNAGYNLSWNARSIANCISQRVTEKIREILAAGPLSVETRALRASWASQYQCDAARYHVDGCANGANGANASAADAGWVLFRPSAPVRRRSATTRVEAVVRPQSVLSASSVVARRTLPVEVNGGATPAARGDEAAERASRSGRAACVDDTASRQRLVPANAGAPDRRGSDLALPGAVGGAQQRQQEGRRRSFAPRQQGSLGQSHPGGWAATRAGAGSATASRRSYRSSRRARSWSIFSGVTLRSELRTVSPDSL